MGGASVRKKREKKKDFQVSQENVLIALSSSLTHLTVESEIKGGKDKGKG